MTLVAGFVCSDGLVLAADTEESTPYVRSRVEKLFTYERDGFACCLAGTGLGDFVDALIQRVLDGFESDTLSTTAEIASSIQDTLLSYYQNELAAHPTNDESEKVIELVIGLRSPDSNLNLLKTYGPSVKRVPTYVIAGSGSLLGHVVESLYGTDVSLQHGIALALHLLNIAKRFIAGVGGESHIATIEASGRVIHEPFLALKEQYLDRFNAAVGELLLQFPDASIHPTHFTETLAGFGRAIEMLREEQFQAVSSAALRDALTNPKHKGWPRPIVPPGTIIQDYGGAVAPPLTPPAPQKPEQR